jgi:hypothetical protein
LPVELKSELLFIFDQGALFGSLPAQALEAMADIRREAAQEHQEVASELVTL